MKKGLFIISILIATYINAFGFVIDGINYQANSDGRTARVVQSTGSYKGNLKIHPTVTDVKGVKYVVTAIEESAFYGSTELTSIVIPSTINTIGEGAFYNCKQLTTITLPNSVSNIGSIAFTGCDNLTTIVCQATNPPRCDGKAFSSKTYKSAKLHVPYGRSLFYMAQYEWQDFGTAIEDDPQVMNPDINGDGVVDIADINTIINVILNQ